MQSTPSRRLQPAPSVVVVESSVVLVELTVVDVSVVEVTVEDVTVVLVPPLQGQLSGTLTPTATFRQSNASVALAGSVPVGAQMHSGVQVWRPTATFRMKRQSVATGAAPLLTGCEH
jgi:hypothetical protein